MAKLLLRGFLGDIDGSLLRQGDFIDPAIAALLRELWIVGFPLGVATGKNADYARGFSVGMGFHWNYVSAEAGGQFICLEKVGPPPVWKQRKNLGIGLAELARFREIIKLDGLLRTFWFRQEEVRYRPELKESILTLFPPDEYIQASEKWLEYFMEVRHTFQLGLTFKRFSDGCIDVMPDGVNKRLGLEEVCRLLNCKPENILTVSDGANDEELVVGTTAIAVANAVPIIKATVKQQGGFLASLPDGQGFAEGVLHYARKKMFGKQSETIEKIVLHCVPQLRK